MRPWPAQSNSSRPPSVKKLCRGLRAATHRAAVAARAGEQRRRRRDRRGIADRDMAHVADQAGDDAGEQFLVAEDASLVSRVMPGLWHVLAVEIACRKAHASCAAARSCCAILLGEMRFGVRIRRNARAAAAARRRARRPRPPRRRSPAACRRPACGSSSRLPSWIFSTVTTVFAAACAIVIELALAPDPDIAVPVGHRRVEQRDIGLDRRQQHDRVVVAERIVDHLPVRPVLEHVGADQSAQRHERHALLGGLEAGVQRRAGRILHRGSCRRGRRR